MKHFLDGRAPAGETARIIGNHAARSALAAPGPGGNGHAPDAALGHQPGHGAHGEMRVEAVTEMGTVVKIVVTCQCGSRAEIVPEYKPE